MEFHRFNEITIFSSLESDFTKLPDIQWLRDYILYAWSLAIVINNKKKFA